MSYDENWSAMKKLKHSLLRRAFDENRGAEVILLIQWRMAYENHMNKSGFAALRAFEENNAGQPRALRMLNLLAAEQGLNVVYKETKPAQHISFNDLMAKLDAVPEQDRITAAPPQSALIPVRYFGMRPSGTRLVSASPDPLKNIFGVRAQTDEEASDKKWAAEFASDDPDIFIGRPSPTVH